MVKVVVFGSTGQSGSRIIIELLSRGHTVVAVARDPKKVPSSDTGRLTVVQGDVVKDDLVPFITGADVIVNAYGINSFISFIYLRVIKYDSLYLAPPFDKVNELITVTEKLIAAVGTTGGRLISVGGAGGLKAGDTLVIDAPWFPAAWKPIAQAHIDALELLRKSTINWTTLTPPGEFAPGVRTGKFRLDEENLVATPEGKSSISSEDYAIALVDEIENPKYLKKRFTVGY